MKNWARNILWTPSVISYPTSQAEVQEIVLRAANDGKKIRLIGTGHSFTPLCATDDILISLDEYQGLISVDQERCRATVKAGTKLRALGTMLFENGMAMENLGDIDAQSIAGTISTGTHGTGKEFGTISTQVVGLTLINGKGDIVKISQEDNPELLRAAQVSLGALGVITSVTLQCIPAYMLQIQNRKELLTDVLGDLDHRLDTIRNFEYYWIPHTDTAWTKSTDIVRDATPDKNNLFHYWSEYVVENYSFKLLCEYARMRPSQNQFAAGFMAGGIKDLKKTDYSHRVYATKRLVRFREMEYNIPADAYRDVWKEIVAVVKKKKFNIHFPVENRWVKGDDILMSPAYGRDSAYIAVHVYNKKPCKDYFGAIETICRAYGGRPHWGKMNTLSSDDIRELYPEFSKFCAIRNEQDPHQIFVNPYLQKLFDL